MGHPAPGLFEGCVASGRCGPPAKRYNLFMITQNEPKPDFVEVIPCKEHFIEANIYKQLTHFKALGRWGRSNIHGDLVSTTTTFGFGVIGQFATKEEAVAATVAEGQKKINEQIALDQQQQAS
jgi:hypothetical protein